jgi:hypothetical protein
MERTNPPKKKSLRKELECYVIAWNTCLKEAVKSMDFVTLLRNAHPAYRGNFASSLKDIGAITPFEASEFIKIVGQRLY